MFSGLQVCQKYLCSRGSPPDSAGELTALSQNPHLLFVTIFKHSWLTSASWKNSSGLLEKSWNYFVIKRVGTLPEWCIAELTWWWLCPKIVYPRNTVTYLGNNRAVAWVGIIPVLESRKSIVLLSYVHQITDLKTAKLAIGILDTGHDLT